MGEPDQGFWGGGRVGGEEAVAVQGEAAIGNAGVSGAGTGAGQGRILTQEDHTSVGLVVH